MKRQERNISVIDLPGERWKAIPDTDNKYHVSSFGRIKKEWFTKAGRIKKVLLNPKSLPVQNFQVIGIRTNEKRIFRYVHDLVYAGFKKYPEDYSPGKYRIVHKDCDGSNNADHNLKCIPKTDRKKYRKVLPKHIKKSIVKEVTEKKSTQIQVAFKYNIPQSTVTRIIQNDQRRNN